MWDFIELITFALGGGLLIHSLRCAWKRSIFIDPPVAFLLPYFGIILLPGLKSDVSLSFVSVFGLFSFALFYPVYVLWARNSPRIFAVLSTRSLLYVLYFMALIYLLTMLAPLYDVFSSYGLSGAFTRDRLTDYFASGLIDASALQPFRLATEASFFTVLGHAYMSRRRGLFWFASLTYLLSLAAVANTRLAVVLPVIAFVGMYVRVRRLPPRYSLIFVLVGLLVMPLYLTYTNLIRWGMTAEGVDYTRAFALSVGETDYNKYISLAEDEAALSGYEYGYGWILGSVANLVPRALWPNKPVTSNSNRYTEIITGMKPSALNPVITFTILGEGYLQLGFPGIALEVFVFCFWFAALFFGFFRYENNVGPLAPLQLCTIMLIYFRAEIPFLQLMGATITLLLLKLAYGGTYPSVIRSKGFARG